MLTVININGQIGQVHPTPLRDENCLLKLLDLISEHSHRKRI